jgi:hypothetical protein
VFLAAAGIASGASIRVDHRIFPGLERMDGKLGCVVCGKRRQSVCRPRLGGDDDEMARLFSYDPSSGSYRMLGMIDVNRRPYDSWQAYVIDAMAVGTDGTMYLGQSERKSKLYVYYPE